METTGWSEWVARDPEWRAALYLLDSPALRAKGVRRFVDFQARTIDVPGLLAASEPWSAGEQLLVKAACSLFNRGAVADVGELVRRLDDGNFARVVEAMRRFRGL